MRSYYHQPGNEDEYEEFCLRFYRHQLKRDGLRRYGKRGQRQYGIDLVDLLAVQPLLAIQCKRREPHTELKPEEIKTDVEEAEKAPHQLSHFIISTTAKKSTRTQDAVIELNLRSSRKFTVELYFWEDICAQLDGLPRAVADLILFGEAHPEGTFDQRAVITQAQSLTRDAAPNDNEMYAEIFKLFEQRKIEAAEYEIEKLPDPEKDDGLTPSQRYSLFRLRGKLALELQEFEEASRLFLLAYDAQPQLEQAKFNRILALEFTRKRGEAFAEAESLVKGGNRSPILLSLLVRNAPSFEQLARYRPIIDEVSVDSEEISLALANSLLGFEELADAHVAAQQALKLEPKSAHAHAAVAMVTHQIGMQGDWRARAENLETAISEYSLAIELALHDKFYGMLPELLHNRARIYGFLRKYENAKRDFREAIKVAEKPAIYAEEALSFFLSIGDYNGANELLPVVDENVGESRFLSLVTQYNNTDNLGTKRELIAKLFGYAITAAPRSVEASFFCVQWCIQLKDYDLALTCITDPLKHEHPFHANTLSAWIALEKGDRDAALSHAEAALEESSAGAHRQEIEILAKVFSELQRDDKALPLWEQTVFSGVLDDNCKNLLKCAQRLNRDDILMRICAELRETGSQDEMTRKLEVQLLSRYSPEKALELAQLFKAYDARYFTAASNFLAARLQLLDQIDLDEARLPQPGQIRVEDSRLIIVPYVLTKRFGEAIRFLYNQARYNFNTARAHIDYFWIVALYGTDSRICDPPGHVDQESAVLLENTTTLEKRWVTIETSNPDAARNEFDVLSPIVQAILGRRVNELIDVPGRTIQPQQERLVEIQTKYVRLFQDVGSQFQNRFPGETFMQQMSLGSDENFNPAPLIRTLEERRGYVNKMMRLYQEEHVCSLFILASRIGVNEYQLMTGLIGDASRIIKCVVCHPKEFEQLANDVCNRKYVLDISAIITLSHLDAWDCLDKDCDYYVSRTTFDLFTEWTADLSRNRDNERGVAFVTEGGKLVIKTVTNDEIDSERNEVLKITANVKKSCSIESSISIAALNSERRELYTDFFGYHTLEAMSIAKDKGAILWTDDFIVGSLANVEFGVERAWTQLELKRALNRGLIDERYFDRASARLAAWNYVSTVWNARTLLSAAELSDWNASRSPFKQCLELIGNCPLPLIAKARVTFEFLLLLTQSECHKSKHTEIVQRSLDSLKNVVAARGILRALANPFAKDTQLSRELAVDIQIWLQSH